MPTPDESTQYIEIADFTPGIYSEFHSAVAPRYTASDTTAGALIGPTGLARVDGTERCHADKTGALVPLPLAMPTGIRDTILPVPSFEPSRPYRYVLDAQLGPILADGDENLPAAFQQFERQTVQMMWGHYANMGASQFKPVVIGREYSPWITFPPTSLLTNDRAIVDFLVAATASNSDGAIKSFLPIGSLARARFYYGFTRPAFGATQYTAVAATDVFTGLQQYQNDEPVVFSNITGTAGIVAGTVYYVRDTGTGGDLNNFKVSLTVGGAAVNVTSDGNGLVARVLDRNYRPYWMLPVSVAMAATPWARWGSGNRWANGATDPATQSFFGVANPAFGLFDFWSPGIGLNGQGTTILAMQLSFTERLFMPFAQSANSLFNWFFHYGENGNVPQTLHLQDIASGPINPYMLLAHQGRVIMPDRRRTFTAHSSGTYGYTDDLFFYSSVHLPMQNFLIDPILSVRGQTNVGYDGWPAATQDRYHTLLAAEDIVADIGTVGVVTVDQLLIVKHKGGGALIAGDLDQPTIHRLPYIESTGGVICKGAPTPVGFVYGSRNGIFMWAGGDNTQKLSPQLDGFFWDHSNGTDAEQYAGSRGRMSFWNGMVCVPNNYIYDIEAQSWWRLAVPTLDPVQPTVTAPFNCYDTDPNNILYAFPYRHTAVEHESYAVWPALAVGLNCLSVADPFGAGTQRDIRFCFDNASATAGTVRTICGQWDEAGNQRSWLVQLDATNHLQFLTSTDGTAGTVITATCDDVISGDPIIGRIKWNAAAGAGLECTFQWKAAAGPIRQLVDSTSNWTQMGTTETSAAAALFNSGDEFVIGNRGNAALSNPFGLQRLFAVFVATTIDAITGTYAHYPENIPANELATSFVAASGQGVTVTRATLGFQMLLDYIDTATPPVWYTFDPDILDTTYSWQSHPIVIPEAQRSLSIQNLQITATSASTTGAVPTITATLRGFNRAGTLQFTRINTVNLAFTDQPQLCRVDIAHPNPIVDYVTIELVASDPNGRPAPKIHNVRYGFKPRAIRPRQG